MLRKIRFFAVFFTIFVHMALFATTLMLVKEGQPRYKNKDSIVQISLVSPAPLEKDNKKVPIKKMEPKKIERQTIIPIATSNQQSASAINFLPPEEKKQPEQIVESQPKDAPTLPPNFNADYLKNPQPKYPLASRKLGEEGKVTVKVLVGTAGEAKKIELKHSCGFSRLDNSALEAIKDWKFIPAIKAGQKIEAWVSIPIIFKLGEGE